MHWPSELALLTVPCSLQGPKALAGAMHWVHAPTANSSAAGPGTAPPQPLCRASVQQLVLLRDKRTCMSRNLYCWRAAAAGGVGGGQHPATAQLARMAQPHDKQPGVAAVRAMLCRHREARKPCLPAAPKPAATMHMLCSLATGAKAVWSSKCTQSTEPLLTLEGVLDQLAVLVAAAARGGAGGGAR